MQSRFWFLAPRCWRHFSGGSAMGKDSKEPYVRVAEIGIDPAQLEPYKAAVKEQIEAAVRLEPGVLALYSVTDKENPPDRCRFRPRAHMALSNRCPWPTHQRMPPALE